MSHARRLDFIKSPTNAYGMSTFIEHVVTLPMEDSRPDDVRSQDADMLQAGYAPEWRQYTPLKRRGVTLTQDTLVRAAVLAVQLGIAYPPERRMIGAPTYIDGPKCLSSILEAIGTDWIEVTWND